MKPIITIDDFAKLELRVGLVLEAAIVEKSEKLIRMKVLLGASTAEEKSEVTSNDSEENLVVSEDVRVIFSGIRAWYQPEDLVGKKFGFICNLAPRKMMGEESQGMMLAAGTEERAFLWPVPDDAPVGAVIR